MTKPGDILQSLWRKSSFARSLNQGVGDKNRARYTICKCFLIRQQVNATSRLDHAHYFWHSEHYMRQLVRQDETFRRFQLHIVAT